MPTACASFLQTELARFMFYIWSWVEHPCLPFARFTAFLGFGFLGKAPSTKCWHIWTFSQPWFFLLIREVVIGWELLTLVLALWPWRSASPENRQQCGHVFLFNVSLVNHFSFQTSMRHYQLVNIFVGQVNIVQLTSQIDPWVELLFKSGCNFWIWKFGLSWK